MRIETRRSAPHFGTASPPPPPRCALAAYVCVPPHCVSPHCVAPCACRRNVSRRHAVHRRLMCACRRTVYRRVRAVAICPTAALCTGGLCVRAAALCIAAGAQCGGGGTYCGGSHTVRRRRTMALSRAVCVPPQYVPPPHCALAAYVCVPPHCVSPPPPHFVPAAVLRLAKRARVAILL